MERVTDVYRSVGTEAETLEILIVSAPRKAEFTLEESKRMAEAGARGVIHKRGIRRVRYSDDHRDKIYIRFSLPREDEGTGLLVWREPARGRDRQWLYLPAMKRVRRVPVSSTQTFVGTNLSYEDVRELSGERTERYSYESAGVDTLDGRECRIVVAEPVADSSSAYSRRKLWIDVGRLFPLKVEYYDRRSILWKVMRNVSLGEVADGVYRPNLTEMRDLQLQETTLLWYPERTVGKSIPPQIFSRDYLETSAE